MMPPLRRSFRELAATLGLDLPVAHVEGDDLRPANWQRADPVIGLVLVTHGRLAEELRLAQNALNEITGDEICAAALQHASDAAAAIARDVKEARHAQ